MGSRQRAVETLFDADSATYLSRHLTAENIREQGRILDLLGRERKYGKVLDIGCGPGTLSEDLLRIGGEIWSIDISPDMIRIADARFAQSADRIHFQVGDAENLTFPDESFDAVICVGVLRYMTSWEKALQEIHRVLKPNGVVVMTFYYRFSPHWFSMYFLYRPLLPAISLVKRRSFKELLLKYRAEPLPFSYRKFKVALSRNGFHRIETQHSGFDLFPFNRLFPRLSRYLYLKAEAALFNSRTTGWLGSICIVKGIKEGVSAER